MKMRSVIEAGHNASPLMDSYIKSLGRCIEHIQVMLDDMSDVKSNLSMSAISSECVKEASFMSQEFTGLKKIWEEFNEKLSAYKYRPRKQRRRAITDLPGQMMLSDEFEEKPDQAPTSSGQIHE